MTPTPLTPPSDPEVELSRIPPIPSPKPRPLTVRLVDCPRYPIETLYCQWVASRTEGDVDLPDTVSNKILAERGARMNQALMDSPLMSEADGAQSCTIPIPGPGPFESEVLDLFRKVLDTQLPLAETLDFVFILDNVPISLREQMVRHRVGVRMGARLGVDHVPDVNGSTWWSQTMRVLDMSSFFDDGRFLLPETVLAKDEAVRNLYLETIHRAQETYRVLLENGVQAEDARQVIPLAATHRISWKLNLAALLHIVGKRGCWIAQLGVWEPVIRGMVEELANKVHPYFRELIRPPCIDSDNKFVGCLYKLDNECRAQGRDPGIPCALYLHHHEAEAVRATTQADAAVSGQAWVPLTINNKVGWQEPSEEAGRRMVQMCVAYSSLWGRNPVTGEKIHRGVDGALTAPLNGSIPDKEANDGRL